VVLCASMWAGSTAVAQAETLPPALIAPLRAQVVRANASLAQARTRVTVQAVRQRRAQSVLGRAEDAAALASGVATLVPGFAQLPVPFDRAARAATSAEMRATRDLDRVTSEASHLQGAALDAQRRIDALRRAASTSAVSPTQEGASYRFGSPQSAAVSVVSLDRYLQSKASPIAGAGKALLAAGVKYHVDPRLVVAIAGAESYFGLQLCAPFNAWGWGCPNGPVRFESWSAAVTAIAQGLREHYIDDGLTTVGEIHLRYAPPNAANDPDGLNYAWSDNVARFLIEQGGDPQQLEGPMSPSR
jgi:hypothetical protein